MEEHEIQRTNDLDSSRVRNNARQALDNAKKNREKIIPKDASSLLKQMDIFTDMPFVLALGAALLKDLIDLVAAETIIFSVLFSILCSIFIAMMLLIAGASGKRKSSKQTVKKILSLLAGGIADSIPGIDFLPIESVTVVVIYVLTLMERKEEAMNGDVE